MSDLVFAPIAVADAHAVPGRFQIWPFGNSALAPSPQAETSDPEDFADQDYARGFSDGCAQSRLEFAAEHEKMLALVTAATALKPEPSDELATVIVEAVNRLTRMAIGNAAIDQDWLIARAKEAAGIVSECDAAQTLWVNAADVALLQSAGLNLTIQADPDAAPGSIRIGCATGWIEHGLPLCLEQLDAATIATRSAT